MQKERFFANARSDVPGPLGGVRVIEITTTWAGPMVGCVLADFGADVIKIELPEGEVARRLPPFLPGTDPPISFAHATVNRNKRSLCLDLRTEAGRDVLRRLLVGVHILVENFRPGTLEAWGVGYEALHAANPALVYVSVTGFGQFGPDHDRAGYDPLAQAASGFISLNGEPEGRPVKAPTFLADDLSGLHGALGAIAAYCHSQRTGEGQHVDVALLDAMLFQSNGFLTLGALDVPHPRMGNEYVFAAPARSFACKDGAAYLGVLLDKHWKTLARLIGPADLGDDPDYATTPGRLQNREDVNAVVAEWCAERTVGEVVRSLAEAGLPVAPVRTYAEAARDPHVRARDMLQPTRQPEGTEIPITGPAAKFSRTPTRVRAAAPDAGQHEAEILTELGLSSKEIASLRGAGAFGTRSRPPSAA